jgi:hypothetical protein
VTIQLRTSPGIGFDLVERTETSVTRSVLEKAGWVCEACRREYDLRICVDKKNRFVVLCQGCRTTPDEFKKVLLRRTYSLKTVSSKESST